MSKRDDQVVRQAPAETDADYFVIEIAVEHNGLIISNDRYERFQNDHPWIEKRRVPVMIINGEVELYEPRLEENREQS